MSRTTLMGTWTEQGGIQVDIEHDGHGCDIVLVDANQHPRLELHRVTLTLDGRRLSVGEAILPPEAKRALRVGQAVCAAYDALNGGDMGNG